LEDPEGLYHTRTTEHVRTLVLCQQLSSTEYSAVAYEYYRTMNQTKQFDFHEYIWQLINYHTHHEQGRRSTPTIHARMVNTGYAPGPPDRPNHQQRPFHRRNNNDQRTDQSPSMFLTSGQHKFFMEHAPQFLDRFKALRIEFTQHLRRDEQLQREVAAQPSGLAHPSEPPPVVDSNQPLKPQYPDAPPTTHVNYVAHDTGSLHDVDSYIGNNHADKLHEDDGIYINDDDAYNALAQNIRTKLASSTPPPSDVTITRANLGRTIDLRSCTSVMAFRSRTTTGFYSTPNGGADTMILGRGWTFLNFSPTRTVNIVGFDERHARRKGCRIGTACTVMRSTDGVDYLMIANEAVQNHDSITSLLSEAQMRHRGLIVDSTSSKHLGINGLPGTQSIQFPDDNVVFDMQHGHPASYAYPFRDRYVTPSRTYARRALVSTISVR
jgi:hypothetical protein